MSFWDNILNKKPKSKPMVFPVGEGMTPEQTVKAKEVISTKPVEKPKSSFWNDIIAPKKAMEFRVGEGLTEEQKNKAEETVRKPDLALEQYQKSIISPISGYYNPIRERNKISNNLNIFLSPKTTKEEKIAAIDQLSAPVIGATSGLQPSGKIPIKNIKGNIKESVLKIFAKDTKPASIERSLKQIGLDDVNAKSLSDSLAKTKTVDEVKEVLGSYKPVSERIPLGEIIKKESNVEDAIEQKKVLLEIKREALSSRYGYLDPILKYVAKRGEFKGRLPEVLGDKKGGLFRQKGDQIVDNAGGRGSEEIRADMEEYLQKRAELKEFESQLKAQQKDVVKQATQAREKRLTDEGYIKPAHLKMDSTGRPLAYTAREKAILEKPKPLEGTPGEIRSIEIQAQQNEDEMLSRNADKNITPRDVSIEEIIRKEQTPLKNKVNLIDYIRTPDRVLKKIGLEKEAGVLRSNYEAYLKELPKNIDKITQWSKQVSPTGNKDIFRYLDGEAITLKPQDQKVADEIRSWLEDWAKKLKLPEDRKITHYITHIFDEQFLAKEFDEDLAKLIDNKLPGQVYDPFLEKRLGAQGYKQDTWAALDAYVKRATRKVNLDPALEQIKDASNKLEKSQVDYVTSYINSINMRPNKLDSLLDNGIKQLIGYRLGQRPTLSITRFLRQMTYRAMLGGNLSSALKNISQGINTYAKLGEKYTTIGYINLFKSGAKAELEAEGILNAGFIEDRALSSTKKILEKFDKALFYFFETAEHINRGAAYFGAKAQGLSKGMSEKEAVEYGKKIVRDTQFTFGKIDTPLVLSSDIGKTIGQFQSFTTKQIEFLSEMGKAAVKGDQKAKNFFGLLRYAAAGTLFVSIIGKAFGMDIKDLIPSVRLGTPPSLKLPLETVKAIVNTPDKYNQPRDLNQKLKDIGNAAIGLIPGGIQGKKTIQGIEALNKGRVEDSSGRAKYDVGGSPIKNIQTIIFGKYVGKGARNYYDKDLNYAEQKLEQIKNSKTGKEDLLKIIKEEPTLAKNITQVLKDQAAGITDEDKKLKNMGVANKQRAKEIAKQLNKLKTKEEKQALTATYIQKKIITPEVAAQLIEFLNK